MTETFDHLAEKIANRRCTQYRNNAGPGEPMYSFTAAHLLDFARELRDELTKGQEPGLLEEMKRVRVLLKHGPMKNDIFARDAVERIDFLLSTAPADAVAKDAERYRWLRDKGCGPSLEKSILVIKGADPEFSLLPEELDAAIDAAMQGEKK